MLGALTVQAVNSRLFLQHLHDITVNHPKAVQGLLMHKLIIQALLGNITKCLEEISVRMSRNLLRKISRSVFKESGEMERHIEAIPGFRAQSKGINDT